MWLIVCLLTLFAGCGRGNKEQISEPTFDVKAKQKLYCDLSRPAYEERRWVHSQCDGLLFTSLRGLSCGDVTIEDFESTVEPGLWFRDPQKSCDLESNSVSNDMILGLMLYAVKEKKTDLLHRFEERSKANDWSIGKCDDAHKENCKLWPTLTGILYDYFKNVGLVDPNSDDQIAVVTGYRAHLGVLHVLLNGAVHGGITNLELALLKRQAERQPRNALYQAAYHLYTDGDQSAAIALFSDQSRYPADKLPNNHDNFCTEYAYQRDDQPSDWDPCPNEVYSDHSGTDLAMAIAVMTGFIK